MPLYEYACEKCGKTFEVMQKMVDPSLTVHEDCGGKLERLLSAPALHFKGSGFYITDYAKGSQTSNTAGKNEGSKGEGGKSDASKSEGSKSEGSKSEGSKSESSKSEGSKSDSSSSTAAPAPTTSSSSNSKS